MKAHQSTVGLNNEWLTPREIIEALGSFDLDPCAPIERPWPTAINHFTITDDGLSQLWFGRVWLNPPFNRYERGEWMRRMAEHNNGIMLIPAACETKAFQRWVFNKCSGLLMLNHRPHFHHVDGTRAYANSGCTICLVAYGDYNFRILKESELGTPLVEQ
jgi:hypothetical protein